MLDISTKLSESCKKPDHSVLSFAFTPSNFSQLNQQSVTDMGVPNNRKPQKHYNFTHVSEGYMSNETWSNEINDIILCIENKIKNESELNLLYEKFCDIIHNELDKYVSFRRISNTLCKKFKYSKPY